MILWSQYHGMKTAMFRICPPFLSSNGLEKVVSKTRHASCIPACTYPICHVRSVVLSTFYPETDETQLQGYYWTLFEVAHPLTLTIHSQVLCFSGQVILKRCCAIPIPAPLFSSLSTLSGLRPIPLSPSPDASPSESLSNLRGFFHGDIRTNHPLPPPGSYFLLVRARIELTPMYLPLHENVLYKKPRRLNQTD